MRNERMEWDPHLAVARRTQRASQHYASETPSSQTTPIQAYVYVYVDGDTWRLMYKLNQRWRSHALQYFVCCKWYTVNSQKVIGTVRYRSMTVIEFKGGRRVHKHSLPPEINPIYHLVTKNINYACCQSPITWHAHSYVCRIQVH